MTDELEEPEHYRFREGIAPGSAASAGIGLKTGTRVYVIKRGKIVDIAEECRQKTSEREIVHSCIAPTLLAYLLNRAAKTENASSSLQAVRHPAPF